MTDPIAADGTILDAILMSNLSQLNSWPPNLTVFLFGRKRFVWWLHIAELNFKLQRKLAAVIIKMFCSD